jgi:hypothetical protein
VNELKKYINQKEMNKIAKTALAMVLAGSFTFSSAALANDTTVDSTQTVEAPTDTPVTNDTVALTNDATVQAKDEVKVEAPKLVPGDFFYFAKLAIEKIKLILTTNDVKEAALLATFASERLAEAESLFNEGKEDLAIKTIQEALEGMKVADSVVEDEKATTVEGEKVEIEDQTKTDSDVATVPTEDTTTDKVAAPTVDESTTDKVAAPIVDESTTDEEAVQEVKEILSQNIIALTAAMEKVKNPVAKAALQRNIEKSYAKLEKKLAKIEARLAKDKEEVEMEVDSEIVLAEQDNTATLETELDGSVVQVATETESTETTLVDDEAEEATTVVPAVKKGKSEEMKAKVAVKQEEKRKKQEAKKEAKQERQKENKELKEKGNKENKGKSEEKKNDKK